MVDVARMHVCMYSGVVLLWCLLEGGWVASDLLFRPWLKTPILMLSWNSGFRLSRDLYSSSINRSVAVGKEMSVWNWRNLYGRK